MYRNHFQQLLYEIWLIMRGGFFNFMHNFAQQKLIVQFLYQIEELCQKDMFFSSMLAFLSLNLKRHSQDHLFYHNMSMRKKYRKSYYIGIEFPEQNIQFAMDFTEVDPSQLGQPAIFQEQISSSNHENLQLSGQEAVEKSEEEVKWEMQISQKRSSSEQHEEQDESYRATTEYPEPSLSSNSLNFNMNKVSQQTRRNIFRMLVDSIEGKNIRQITGIIHEAAEKYNTPARELSTFLAMYKMVFSLEKQRDQNGYSEQKVLKRVEEELVKFINQNVNIRKYKLAKISAGLAKSLQIKKYMGKKWLNKLIISHKQQIDPRVNLNNFIDAGKLIPKKERKKAKYKSEEYLGGLIMQIDKQIEKQIKFIFREKSIQANIDVLDLKEYYQLHGKLGLFRENENREYVQANPNLLHERQEPKKIEAEEAQVRPQMKQLQKILTHQMRKCGECQKRQLAKRAYIITQMNPQYRSISQDSLTAWLKTFIASNCLQRDNRISLKAARPELTRRVLPSPFLFPKK